MSDWYILNEDKTTRKANDTPDDKNLAYQCVEGKSKIVAQEHVGNAWVSTVFLGLDHSWGGGPPMLFETMVFRDDHGEDTWRYLRGPHFWVYPGRIRSCQNGDRGPDQQPRQIDGGAAGYGGRSST